MALINTKIEEEVFILLHLKKCSFVLKGSRLYKGDRNFFEILA